MFVTEIAHAKREPSMQLTGRLTANVSGCYSTSCTVIVATVRIAAASQIIPSCKSGGANVYPRLKRDSLAHASLHPNDISIGIFFGLCMARDHDQHTQTDRPRYVTTFAAIARITLFAVLALRANNNAINMRFVHVSRNWLHMSAVAACTIILYWYAQHKMRPIVTDLPWSATCVCCKCNVM